MCRKGRGVVALAGLAAGLAVALGAGAHGQGPASDNAAGGGRAKEGAGPLTRAQRDNVSEDFGGYASETRPCKDSMMQFSFATEVREVNVRAGDRVERGQVLVRARDAELKAAVEQQKLVAGSTLDIEGRQKQHELAAFRFERLKSSRNYSPMEFREAEIAAEIGRVQLETARLEHAQQQERLKQLVGQYERSYLEAPFDGVVEEVFVEVGQGVNEQQKALRVVDVSRLWLDAAVDTGETIDRGLAPGAEAWVLIDLPTPAMVEGKVLNLSPVADSVSQTRRVRVEIVNAKAWPAGVPARVRFTQPDPKFAQYRVQTSSVMGGSPRSGVDVLAREIEAAGGLNNLGRSSTQANIGLNLRMIASQTQADIFLKPEDCVAVRVPWDQPLAVIRISPGHRYRRLPTPDVWNHIGGPIVVNVHDGGIVP